ncbi:MAG: outer membrane beta-barrel protein [Verrucomicrobiales bacterium]|nr:outer membrane beta-barrel protein [Verrucomicrobiales bacterium]
MKLLTFALLSLLIALPAVSRAQSYVFGYGGFDSGLATDFTEINSLSLDFENGVLYGAGLGRVSSLIGGSRFEFEGLRSHSDLESAALNGMTINGIGGEMTVTAGMFNFLKQFPLMGTMTYLGGGIGYSQVETEFGATSNSSDAVAYQVIVGAELPLGQKFQLFTQYKFLGIGETDFGAAGNMDGFTSHNFIVGLKYCF